MITQPYLIINKKGAVRVCKTNPSLSWDEIAIRVSIELPDMLFQKPQLSATIKVNEKDVTGPIIEPELIESIQDAIKQHSGVSLRISVVSEETK